MIVVRKPENLKESLEFFRKRIALQWTGENPIELSFKAHRPQYTRSQQNLYRRWCRDLGRALGQPEDTMHDLLRYKFLGSEEVIVGEESFTRLVSTTKLNRLAMSEYMHKVEVWAMDLGVHLLIPGENEYAQYREAAT